jgi:hypothetical protein
MGPGPPGRQGACSSRRLPALLIRRMRFFFTNDIEGQFMRARGATISENGVPPNLIQAIERWASSAFQFTSEKTRPLAMAALLFWRAAQDPLCQ